MSLFDDVGALVSAQVHPFSSELNRVGLNPQPLPPKEGMEAAELHSSRGAMLTVLKDFDPVEPDPLPRPDAPSFVDAIAGVLEQATTAAPPLAIYEGIELVEPWSNDDLSALQDMPLGHELSDAANYADAGPAPDGAGDPPAFEAFQATEVAVQETSASY